MYSALKKGGVRLYRLARQGRDVPREPRRIQIERLRLSLPGPTGMKNEVACSQGTYSRALDFLRGLQLSNPVVARLRMGQQEALSGLPAPEGGEGMMRLLDSQDSLVALARWVDDAADRKSTRL